MVLGKPTSSLPKGLTGGQRPSSPGTPSTWLRRSTHSELTGTASTMRICCTWRRPSASTHAGLLDRAAALEIPQIKDIFHVADHIVEQDPTVKAHLASA